MASPHDKVLGCDTDWRRRYVGRTRHPETDAEKMRAEGEKIIELSRTIPSDRASGEFIGVAKFTTQGAGELIESFDQARQRFAGQVFREKRTFERAYLIDLFQDMIEKGSTFHRVDTDGGYMEIDTLQDESMAAGVVDAEERVNRQNAKDANSRRLGRGPAQRSLPVHRVIGSAPYSSISTSQHFSAASSASSDP